MANIMEEFRKGLDNIGGYKVIKTLDYLQGIDKLPTSNIMKFCFADGSSIIIRPSGTEP